MKIRNWGCEIIISYRLSTESKVEREINISSSSILSKTNTILWMSHYARSWVWQEIWLLNAWPPEIIPQSLAHSLNFVTSWQLHQNVFPCLFASKRGFLHMIWYEISVLISPALLILMLSFTFCNLSCKRFFTFLLPMQRKPHCIQLKNHLWFLTRETTWKQDGQWFPFFYRKGSRGISNSFSSSIFWASQAEYHVIQNELHHINSILVFHPHMQS